MPRARRATALTPHRPAVYVISMARPRTKPPKAAARPSSLATQIAQRWGDAGGDVTLERLSAELGEVQRYDLVSALKELERAGAGEFIVGRSGQKARFSWRSGAARALGASESGAARAGGAGAARGQGRAGRGAVSSLPAGARAQRHVRAISDAGATAEPPPSAAGPARRSQAPSVLEHVFHLRPDHVVTVQLPADVSRVEVERFCQFLRALPFKPED